MFILFSSVELFSISKNEYKYRKKKILFSILFFLFKLQECNFTYVSLCTKQYTVNTTLHTNCLLSNKYIIYVLISLSAIICNFFCFPLTIVTGFASFLLYNVIYNDAVFYVAFVDDVNIRTYLCCVNCRRIATSRLVAYNTHYFITVSSE